VPHRWGALARHAHSAVPSALPRRSTLSAAPALQAAETRRLKVTGNAGSWTIDPVFDETKFKIDYLTQPSGLLDIGIDLSRFNPADHTKDTDELFIVAYPHFDPRELIAVEKLWRGAGRDSGRPLILFNAELDRLRSNYYPSLFYPAMARLSKEFVPLIETAFYIHNFKGSGGGALFRVYPEPWQVLLRLNERMLLVHTQEERPSLREVALDILPGAVRKLQQQQAQRKDSEGE